MYKRGQSRAIDAASGSGNGFLSSMFEEARAKLVLPLASTIYDSIIDVDATQSGFPEFLPAYRADYGSVSGGENYGFQGTGNTDINVINVDTQKGLWRAYPWAQSMVLTNVDIWRMETAVSQGNPPPFSLQTLLDTGVRLVYNKALDRVATIGVNGNPGLLNNPNVVQTLAAPTGTGGARTFASKLTTPDLIVADINAAIVQLKRQTVYANSVTANTILLTWDVWASLLIKVSQAGNMSILEYILKNNAATLSGTPLSIIPVPTEWMGGLGAGGTNRMVVYAKSPENVCLPIPQMIKHTVSIPTTRNGGSVENIFNACVGQVQWLRSQTAVYVDNV